MHACFYVLVTLAPSQRVENCAGKQPSLLIVYLLGEFPEAGGRKQRGIAGNLFTQPFLQLAFARTQIKLAPHGGRCDLPYANTCKGLFYVDIFEIEMQRFNSKYVFL